MWNYQVFYLFRFGKGICKCKPTEPPKQCKEVAGEEWVFSRTGVEGVDDNICGVGGYCTRG